MIINFSGIGGNPVNVYIARQPILDVYSDVCAYELIYKGKEYNYSSIPHENIENPFFGISVNDFVGDSKVYINFSTKLLEYGAAKYISPDKLTVVVTEEVYAEPEAARETAELKERGYTIALGNFRYDGAVSELFGLADVIMIDYSAPQKKIDEALYVCKYSNKTMAAVNVDTRDKAQSAEKAGCVYFEGFFFAKPMGGSELKIEPLPSNLAQVLQLMSQPYPEINDIVEILSRDTAMCQRILRLINSVYFGVSNKVSTINQAILILGLDYLREWVYLMSMQKISRNDSAAATRMALLMAKFCQKIALHVPEEAKSADSFYLMGLLSMVVFSGDTVLAQALDEFPLADDIKKGLLRRGGIYSDIFEIALSYATAQWDNFDAVAENYCLNAEMVCDMYVECTKEIVKIEII